MKFIHFLLSALKRAGHATLKALHSYLGKTSTTEIFATVLLLMHVSVLMSTAQAQGRLPANPRPPIGPGIGSGVGSGVIANYIYDELTGNNILVTGAMNGHILANPRLVNVNSRKYHKIVEGSGEWTEATTYELDSLYNHDSDQWTESFDMEYGRVLADPDWEEGDPIEEKYLGQGPEHDSGGDYLSAYSFRQWMTVRKKYSEDVGVPYYPREGVYLYRGGTVKITTGYKLVSTISSTDNRLMNGQKYQARVWYRLADMVYRGGIAGEGVWDEFEQKDRQFKTETLSATHDDSERLYLLTKNTKLIERAVMGSSTLRWRAREVKPWFAKNYILWERQQTTTTLEQP
ncbi:MAG: hypothetical protein M2R45_00322 [Verrucomicrobia subdivision 3 bacterium]|nr:hypothetical protein [Limisphaerales bacterium]MCS1412919.1 hypothetical protein [Limisphaerales bacterium]